MRTQLITQDAKIQPNPVSFNTAISSLPGGWPRALLLIDQMAQADVMRFNAAMSCCKKDAAWREALGILDAMVYMTLSPNLVTYNTAINCCENDGEWQTALRLLEAIDESRMEADVISYSAAISSHAKMGRWEEAISFWLVLWETFYTFFKCKSPQKVRRHYTMCRYIVLCCILY